MYTGWGEPEWAPHMCDCITVKDHIQNNTSPRLAQYTVIVKGTAGSEDDQVECVHSTHSDLLPDKSMLWVEVRWSRDKAGCESQKFNQVSPVHELPAQPLIHSWNPSVCYVAQSLSVELVPVQP